MEEVFENPILEDLFNIRTDGFQGLYEKSFQNRGEIEKRKTNLKKIFKQLIKDENERKNVIELCEELFYEEMNYWNLAYYKLGVCDGIFIGRDVKAELDRLKKK